MLGDLSNRAGLGGNVAHQRDAVVPHVLEQGKPRRRNVQVRGAEPGKVFGVVARPQRRFGLPCAPGHV
jgi:hypothetical protein